MAAMTPSKTRSGLFEAISNKPSTPSTPRRPSTPKSGSKVNRVGSLKSEPNSPSPTQNPRPSFDRSPKPTEPKPAVDRRSPKTATPDKQLQPRPLKGTELQSQLDSANEELKKAKEQLASLEKEKISILNELQEAKNLADAANEQLQDAIAAQRRAEEATEIEKFRAIELEQCSIDAAQTREQEWKSELERVKNQHKSDISVLVATKEQLEQVKHELEMSIEEKNSALSRAETAMQVADGNMEKAELLSNELTQLKAQLNSRLENEMNEAEEIITKLKSEIVRLQEELESSKKSEKELVRIEEIVEKLKNELSESRRAEMEASNLVDEWRVKAEELENRLEEVQESEKCKTESLVSAMQQLEGRETLLHERETEIHTLKEKMKLLETDVARFEAELAESNKCLEATRQDVFELETTAELLRNKLENSEEAKLEALTNEKSAVSQIECLTEEKERVIAELEKVKLEEGNNKKAMEDLASALHEASADAREAKENVLKMESDHEHALAQIGDLKLALKSTKDSYEVMLDEVNYEVACLRKTVEKLESEAKAEKNDRDLKDNEVLNSKQQSEEEIMALKVEVDKVMASLKGTEMEMQAAKEEKEQLLEKLRQAELHANEASKVMEEARTESMQLKERLLDKENELQSITQENDELRARQSKSEERINELCSKLQDVTAEKAPEMPEEGNTMLDVAIEEPKVEEDEEEEKSLNRYKEEEPNGNAEQESENGDAKQEEAEEGKVAENEPLPEEKCAEDEKVDLKSGNGNLDGVDNESALDDTGKKENLSSKKRSPLSRKISGLFKRKSSQKQ